MKAKWQEIAKTARAVLGGIIAGSSVGSSDPNGDKSKVICGAGYATYGIAIAAITQSDMLSFWKADAIKNVPKDCKDPGLYAAVVAIANDRSMSDFWKADAIRKLF